MTSHAHNLVGSGARLLVERMGEASAQFMASLAGEQRAKALLDFADLSERTRWYYTPNPRRGLPLRAMTRHQQRLAHQLVALGLSRTGFATAAAIIGLEMILDAVEEWQVPEPGRDPGLYYLSIFGEPDLRKPWGWRFEGHHLSLNYTIVDSRIVSPTPTFFGANPAEVALGGVGTLRPLAGVEDIARELVHALNPEQRRAAILSPAAPPDIVMSNRPMVVAGAVPLPTPLMQGRPFSEAEAEQLQRFKRALGYSDEHEEALRYTSTPKGLPASALTAAQREMLMAVLREYINRMPEELAEIEMAQLQPHGLDSIHFVWAGSVERRQPHYYRLEGSRFLVEYDETQNDANHIHSVWRDITNDFGADVLAQHYALAHAH